MRARDAVPTVAQCERCPAGHYQTFSGMVWHHVCFACPAGRFAVQPGQTTCRPCQPGRFALRSGQVTCDSCVSAPRAGVELLTGNGGVPVTEAQRWEACKSWSSRVRERAAAPIKTNAPTPISRSVGTSPTHFDWSFLGDGDGGDVGVNARSSDAVEHEQEQPTHTKATQAAASRCPTVTMLGKRLVVVRVGMPYTDAGAVAVDAAGADASALIDAVVQGGDLEDYNFGVPAARMPTSADGVKLNTLHPARYTITYKVRRPQSDALGDVQTMCDASAPVRTILVRSRKTP